MPPILFNISAVMLHQNSQHPWGKALWSLLGLMPGLTDIELQQAQTQGELHYFSDLTLQLFPLHCEAYYHNLMSERPKVYLICQQQSEFILKPLLLTVDYDEAASYMETSEHVFDAILPEKMCKWLEQFVIAHYQPEMPKKRHRKKWHDTESQS